MKFIIDSSSLIHSARHYYPPELFGDFWNYLISLTQSGELIIISRVKNELLNGFDGDYLKETFARQITQTNEEISEVWDKFPIIAQHFPPKDQVGILSWIQRQTADPFIVAYALYLKDKGEECIVINGENDHDDKVKISRACRLLDIR